MELRKELLEEYKTKKQQVTLKVSERFYKGFILDVNSSEILFNDRFSGKMSFKIEIIESVVPVLGNGEGEDGKS